MSSSRWRSGTRGRPGWSSSGLALVTVLQRAEKPDRGRDESAIGKARDGYALPAAVYHDAAPTWLRQRPAIATLRQVLLPRYPLDRRRTSHLTRLDLNLAA
jgi:hypothetical protein